MRGSGEGPGDAVCCCGQAGAAWIGRALMAAERISGRERRFVDSWLMKPYMMRPASSASPVPRVKSLLTATGSRANWAALWRSIVRNAHFWFLRQSCECTMVEELATSPDAELSSIVKRL